MIHSPLLELYDKLVKWWNGHTTPYRIWYGVLILIAFFAGFILNHNWRLSLGLFGVDILVVCIFAWPISQYEKRHLKNTKGQK